MTKSAAAAAKQADATTLTADDLTAFQDECVAAVKDGAGLEHEIAPVVFILALRATYERVLATVEATGQEQIQTLEPGDGGDLIAAGFSMSSAPLNLFAQLMLIPGPHVRLLRELEAAGMKELGLARDDSRAMALQGIQYVAAAKGEPLDVKAIQAKFIRTLIEMAGAFAYVKVDEAWVNRARATAQGALDAKTTSLLMRSPTDEELEAMGAVEVAAINMETAAFQRVVLLPIVRGPRGADGERGVIASFGEATIHDTRDPGMKPLASRFAGLMRQAAPKVGGLN